MNRLGWHNLRHRKNRGTSCLILILLGLLIVLLGVYAHLNRQLWQGVESPPLQAASAVKAITVSQTIPQPAPDSTAKTQPSTETLKQARMPAKGDYLLVEKSRHLLHHYRDGIKLATYSVALGKNPEDKAKEGDNATPEGHFEVNFIKDASGWTHDFKDGKGEIKGAYGPFFIALYTGAKGSFSGKTWRGIGIHGTHDPASIGTNASEGCIRLHNSDLLKLKQGIEAKGSIPVDIIK